MHTSNHSVSGGKIDPRDTMILFADLQMGIVELQHTNEPERLRHAVGALARLAALFQLPVVITTAPGPEGPAQVLPEITAALGERADVVRHTTDAFTSENARAAIEATGRRTLLVAGVATEIVVQHTCLSAAANGYRTQVVIDACGGVSPRTEDAALRRLAVAGVVPTSIPSLAGELAGDFTQPLGAQALSVLFEMAGG